MVKEKEAGHRATVHMHRSSSNGNSDACKGSMCVQCQCDFRAQRMPVSGGMSTVAQPHLWNSESESESVRGSD